MKRSVLRIGCAVLSLSAAAGLLASCSLLPPASPLPDSKPAQAEEAPGPAAASLDDGKLRILYSNGSNGGNTVLCGNTVLYQAASSETVYLVPDTLTGTVRYYLRQWSAPGTPTGRATALCDRSGKEILTFDRAYDAALTGSLLVLTAPEQMAYAPCNNHAAGDCRVLDLATGEELTGFQQYTGAGTVSLYNNGRYQLVDLVSTEQSAVLCEYDQPIRYYAPGVAITEPDASTPEMAGRYLFHDLLTGEEKDLYDANTDDATLAIYAVDGTVRVFDLQTGVLLTDTTIDPVDHQVRAHIYPEGNGWAWVEQDDNDSYDATAIHICGPDGIHKTLDPAKLNETYNYYSPLLSTEDGIYFYGCYNGPGSSWLYDVLDSDGDVVVSGLRTCAGYYANSVNGLPEGVFAAVKGFESGWMDLTGQWLYAESIFASSNDEMDNGFF